MSDSEHESDGPVSQFSIEDDADFIVLHHHLTGCPGSDGDLSSAFDGLSVHDSSSSDAGPNGDDRAPSGDQTRDTDKPVRGSASETTKYLALSSSASSSGSEYHSGSSTPTASYDDASAFITRFISSPVRENDAELDLLRALTVELGIRSPNAPDIPRTLTSARKILKAEAHVNIKEYVATRHKGQSALRGILKPSRSALRKDIRRGNRVSLKWVKQRGLQVLLVTCFTKAEKTSD